MTFYNSHSEYNGVFATTGVRHLVEQYQALRRGMIVVSTVVMCGGKQRGKNSCHPPGWTIL